MSKIALSGNASGTGTLTIAAPNTDSDRTLTLPDATGIVFVSGQAVTATTGNFSGNVTLGSSVLATPTGSAPSYTCRAWVNFNGTGTVAIRASGNVSSITDGGTGRYTVNFTTALPDANYAVNVTGDFPGGASSAALIGATDGANNTSSSAEADFCNGSFLFTDPAYANVAIFR
jgi:hypothetical protein